jgi:hypothetical protein
MSCHVGQFIQSLHCCFAGRFLLWLEEVYVPCVWRVDYCMHSFCTVLSVVIVDAKGVYIISTYEYTIFLWVLILSLFCLYIIIMMCLCALFFAFSVAIFYF